MLLSTKKERQEFQGKLATVKPGQFFFVYASEDILEGEKRLVEGENVFVLDGDEAWVTIKVLTRVGIGFTLYLELRNITVIT